MEDGATGDKLGNVAVTVSNSWDEIATSRHQAPEEDPVQGPKQEKVNAGLYLLLFIYINSFAGLDIKILNHSILSCLWKRFYSNYDELQKVLVCQISQHEKMRKEI